MTIDGHQPLILLVLLPLVLYVAIFIHELGHAVIGHAVGFVVTSLGLGTGRPFLTFAVCGKRIFFCRSNPFQGLTFCCFAQTSPSIRRMVSFLAGGIIANGLLALVALVLWRSFRSGGMIWLTVAGINAILAFSCMIPMRMQVGNAVLRSDALLILQALRGRMFVVSPPVVIQSVHALRGLWESIGDRHILHANLLSEAVSWADLGDFERAGRVYTELESLPVIPGPGYLARLSLVRVAITCGTGRLDVATACLESALALYRAGGDQVGPLYVALARANVRILKGDIAGTVADLDNFASDPFVRRRIDFWIGVVVARLTASVVLSDMSAVEEHLARYEAARRKQPSAARDLRVYRTVASFYAKQGNWLKAEPAFRAAIEAIDDLAGAWTDPSERSRFMQRQAGWLTEAGDCLRALNKVEDAERLIETHCSADAFQQVSAEAQLERHRRLFRIGVRILGVNVVISFILIGLAAVLGLGAGPLPIMLAFTFVMFAIVAAFYLLFHLAIGRFVPALRHSGGAVILVLACLPWLYLILLPVFFMLDPMR